MMGDGLYIVCSTTQVSIHTHKHTHRLNSHREQFEFQYLARGHFDIRGRGSNHRPPSSGRWLYPPRATLVISPDAPQLVFRKKVSQKGVSTLLKYASSLFWAEAAASCKEQIEQGRKSDTQKNGNEPLPSRRNSRERNHLTLQRV